MYYKKNQRSSFDKDYGVTNGSTTTTTSDPSSSSYYLDLELQDRYRAVRSQLSALARAKTIIGGGIIGTDDEIGVVESPLIKCILESYRCNSTCRKGRVIVASAPEDSGKTYAAEFLMHGNHPIEPVRALQFSAAGMKNFAKECITSVMGIQPEEQRTPMSRVLVQLLCCALTSSQDDENNSIPSSAIKQSKKATKISLRGSNSSHSSEGGVQGLPLLVIDNFDEASEENQSFINKLIPVACDRGIFVLLLTSNSDWATRLVSPGNNKIKPLYGNVDNADYDGIKRFRGVPEWNTMSWPVKTLKELIKPLCDDPTDIIQYDDYSCCDLSPTEALDQAMIKKAATTHSEKKKFPDVLTKSENNEPLDNDTITKETSSPTSIIQERVIAVEKSLVINTTDATAEDSFSKNEEEEFDNDTDEETKNDDSSISSVQYEDNYIILTSYNLTLKKYFKPEGRSKVIPLPDIQRVWLGTDPQLGLNYFKKASWGNASLNSNGIWWTMANSRENNDDTHNFVVCNSEKERHGFTVERPNVIKTLLASYIQECSEKERVEQQPNIVESLLASYEKAKNNTKNTSKELPLFY